jgi:HSP20 family protein
MNRLLSGPASRVVAAPSYPAMNVWSNEEGAIVTAELPGLAAEDIDISVEDNVLTLSGERESLEAGEDVTYHRQERGYGSFTRSLRLPYEVETEQVEAAFENGVLRITLPRSEADKPRKITIKSA